MIEENNNIIPDEDLKLISKLSSVFKEEREKIQIAETVKAKIASSSFLRVDNPVKRVSKVMLYGIPGAIIITAVAIYSILNFDDWYSRSEIVPVNSIIQPQKINVNINTNTGNTLIKKYSRRDKTALNSHLNKKKKEIANRRNRRVIAGINPDKNQKSNVIKIKKSKPLIIKQGK